MPRVASTGVRLVGVCKELAPTKDSETDEILGVGEFLSTYFAPGELYLDSEMATYKALGSRAVPIGWNPMNWYRLFNSSPPKDKNVSGNLKGEGVLQGGVLVLDKSGTVRYMSLENTWQRKPLWLSAEEVIAAVEEICV